jgi:proteasome lid subunit RPN8/RPN11
MKELVFTPKALFDVHRHLISTYPHEGCGFFYGKIGERKEVLDVREVKNQNTENPERAFEISGIDYVKAERYALENNLDLLGVYHSHPDHPAVPSEHDLRYALPNFSYIIVSVIRGEIAATSSWTLNEENKFIQEQVFEYEEHEIKNH